MLMMRTMSTFRQHLLPVWKQMPITRWSGMYMALLFEINMILATGLVQLTLCMMLKFQVSTLLLCLLRSQQPLLGGHGL